MEPTNLIESAEMYGWQTLSDLDLFTVVTGSRESGEAMLRYFEQGECSVDGLMNLNIGGMGRATAMKIKAMYTLFRRSRQVKVAQLLGSEDLYKFLAPHLQNLTQEEFWVVLLDARNRPLRKFCHARGGSSCTVVDIRLIIKTAMETKKCTSIVVAHNHPSGTCAPSELDKKLTNRFVDACALLEIQFLDHIIVAGDSYYSFSDNDMLKLDNALKNGYSICKL